MASHNNTGKQGEALAVEYFSKNGYEILHKNWRHKHWEVDIIASKNAILYFIEVKTKTSLKFGFPEEKVDSRKIRYLVNASEEFLHLNPQWQRIQFNVLSVMLQKNNQPQFFLIEDVYL